MRVEYARRVGLVGVYLLSSAAAWGQEVKDGASPSSAIPLHLVASGTPAAPTEASSAEEVMGWLLARGLTRKTEELDLAEKILSEASNAEPEKARWLFGRALVMRSKGGTLTPARELMERVVKLEPEHAKHQFWLGTITFESINEAATLRKMGLADQGKAALEKALTLDPNQPMARYSLAQFYINAPGIAGGSYRKAREQAKALFAMPEGMGEFLGHLVLALTAAHDEEWKEMSKEFEAAEKAGGEGADPKAAMLGHIDALLKKKEDPKAAMPIIERYLKAAEASDARPHTLLGEARRQLKQYAEALEPFRQALALNPKSKMATWGLAECAEKTGDAETAIAQYRAFAERFPEDDRASKAKGNAERLERKRK